MKLLALMFYVGMFMATAVEVDKQYQTGRLTAVECLIVTLLAPVVIAHAGAKVVLRAAE